MKASYVKPQECRQVKVPGTIGNRLPIRPWTHTLGGQVTVCVRGTVAITAVSVRRFLDPGEGAAPSVCVQEVLSLLFLVFQCIHVPICSQSILTSS